jgi:ATP-dependent DNA ligase
LPLALYQPSVSRYVVPIPRDTDVQVALAKRFHRDGWVYEENVDGWRILAVKRGGVVRLWSRTGRDHARRFPALARGVAALPAREVVVDGEVAVFDTQLVSRFEYLTMPPPPDVVITRHRCTSRSTRSSWAAGTCARSRFVIGRVRSRI